MSPQSSEADHIPKADPVAVIGIGCRLPGAHGPGRLWELLRAGQDATGVAPADRFPAGTTPPAGGARGGFVHGVDEFDAEFFGVTADEAATMDPQQRLLLHTAWEALEDAGRDPGDLADSATAVFVGQSHADHWDRLRETRAGRLDLDCLVGGHQRSMLAGRLSFHLGLHGPSVTVDCAQASSLAAVHLACLSLRAGESALALAGGANLVLGTTATEVFDGAGVLSSDGRCRFGDGAADGFVRSDGVAVVVLKRLDRALADGDPVRAVILGSALGHDGATKRHVTDPSVTGQSLVMRRAYRSARVAPGDVGYVEAHGTGTRIDAVELGALNEVLAENRPQGRPCLVGSLKSNIGHCEAAAGVAGLVKTVLCLEHREVPPTLHADTPSPLIDWDRLPLVLPDSTRPWPAFAGRPALAAVNGQGMSGVNAHLVIGPGPAEHTGAVRGRSTAGRVRPAPRHGRPTGHRPSSATAPAARAD
ncbi:polyketide synthase [Streptomyces sp. VNUA74]|uniref:beta-ketoacyl [acyl carrier protein] synthase domain-containing protein n=1 Tax=Streptomyces sp. VNUA74 TaxID=3062685 RepID=UPI00280BDCD9|nr:polyketide synthase [Streptomyces sp. VNUA74]WML82839.1 polyketide synthase [Streptomyces sp. VNUA74]